MQLILACSVSLMSYIQTMGFIYIVCRSDIIPTDNSFMHEEVTSPTCNTLTSNYFYQFCHDRKKKKKKTDFSIYTDSTGAHSMCKAKDELPKNGREDDRGFESLQCRHFPCVQE